jgi:hypothetical protein
VDAKRILDQVPADAQITIIYDNPQEGSDGYQVTYNVRELMLQDLMLSTDRADRMDMDVDDSFVKAALGGFLNFLKSQDPAWESTIQTAANDIFFDLKEEIPDYA